MTWCAFKRLTAKNKIDGAKQAKAGPNIVGFEWLAHIENGKGYEHTECDDFLRNFELSEAEALKADSVGGHLQQVLEQSDAPTCQRSKPPWLVRQILQVRIPGKGHEDIGEDEQTGKGASTIEHGRIGRSKGAKNGYDNPPTA